VWIDPNAFFLFHNDTRPLKDDSDQYDAFLTVYVGTEASDGLVSVFASSLEHATVACDMLLRFLVTSEDTKIKLDPGFQWGEYKRRHHQFPVTGPALSHFLVHNRNLLHLELSRFRLDTDHCRAIDTIDPSTNVSIDLDLNECFPSEIGEQILLESIRQNRGPTKLDCCEIGTRRLVDAMRGNNRINYLALSHHEHIDNEGRVRVFQALAHNEGMTSLSICFVGHTDEEWTALWQSVSRHPKLERISLGFDGFMWEKTLRTQAIVDALRNNTVLFDVGPCR
jgi:hypothetical protein